jgi:hypothetical protein
MLIRKVSIGADYKASAMHYIVGQSVLNGSYQIHEIKEDGGRVKIWISSGEEGQKEIVLWKCFNENMPVSFEYNIDFE